MQQGGHTDQQDKESGPYMAMPGTIVHIVLTLFFPAHPEFFPALSSFFSSLFAVHLINFNQN
jgi:hypothetical protein